MFLIIFAALIAAGETAKLDRTYLPPVSAANAGGSPGSLQLPFSRSNEGSQGSQELPTGGFVNDHQGVVVEAALAGTRASGLQSGLGGPRISYGSSDSKVGDAAFRVTNNRLPQGPANGLGPNGEPDLSAFYRPPSAKPGNIQIVPNYVPNTVKYQNNIGIDKFNYAFETDNGIKMSENGISRNGIQAQGGFSYTGDDGKVYSVVYTADKNGYRPTGNHLPTPPPIPAEILESLKQNARDEAAGLVDDGSYDAKKYNTENDYSENEANDKYNDRQSNKFGDRPVFAGGFINQNQQAFVTPNFNGQFGVNDVSKDSSFSKPDSSKFGSLMQSGNRFGSIQESSKSVPNLLSNKQAINQLSTSSNGAADLNLVAKPLSQQNLQEQKPFRKPFNRPSSYDTSNFGILSSSNLPSQPSSVNSFDSSYHGAYNFGSGENRPSDQAFYNKPAQGPFILGTLSQGLPIENSSNLNTLFSDQNLSSTLTSSQPSTGYYTNKPIQQFPPFNIQSNQNGRLPGSQFSSLGENSIQSLFSTSLKPTFPNKHPSTTLTTPLESFEASNEGESLTQADISKNQDLDKTKSPMTSQGFTSSLSQSTPNISEDSFTSYTRPQASSFNSLGNRFSGTQTTIGQDSSSFKQPSDAEFSSNTQKPSYESTQFIQSQAPDHSYIYNRPNKPFDTPFVGSGSISSSNSNGQVTPLLPQTSFFTNAPQTSISSTKNEDIMRLQSSDSSRFTEASFSTFPSTVSGVSSKLNNRPSFNIQNVSSFSQVSPTSITATAQTSTYPNSETVSTQGIQETQFQDENTRVPLQEKIKEIYQYPKPTEGLPSQSGQENTASTDSSFPQFIEFGSQKPTTHQSSFSLIPQSQFVQGSTFTSPPQLQFGHENFEISPKNPEQSFGFQSRPQAQEFGLFGNKGQNLNLASQLSSKPIESGSSFSQGTTSDNDTPSVLSQTEQETSFKPTEQPTTQNTQSTFDNTEITSSQLQESAQPSISPFVTPFGINTQRPFSQFGQQSSFFSRHPTTQPALPVISQFPSLTSKFGNKPTSVSTQFGIFNTQNQLSEISEQSSFTTKKPFSQTSPINSHESTQFNEVTLNNKQTPTFEHTVDGFDDKHSTSLPSSTQFQTGLFDTQRPSSTYLPTQTQFGQSSFSITSLKPSSQSQFGSQQGIASSGHGSFINKDSTFSQYEQSTQKFVTHFENKVSTQKPSYFQTQFKDYNKETTNTQFTLPTTLNFDQFISTNQPSQPSTLFTGKFGQENESKTTTSAQFDTKQQSTTTNDPSTLISSTFEIQTPTQNTEFGLIYDYKKPDQGLITSSQKQDKPQFQFNTQFGQQGLLSVQKQKPAQFTQSSFNSPNSQFSTTNQDKTESVTQQHIASSFASTHDDEFSISQNNEQSSEEIYEYNKPSTVFGQQSIFNIQKEKPTQFTKPIFNSQFTTNEDKTESVTQENILTGFPSTPEVSSSTLQNASQTNGEINEYNKLNYQFGQQGLLNVQKEKPAQSSFNFANSQYDTNIDKTESVTQENILTGFPSTQEAFSSTSQNANQSTGEIYEYNKPEQSLSTSSETDGTTQSEQKIQTISNVNTENFFTNHPTTSQFGQTTFNVDNKNTDDLTSTTSEGTTDQPLPQLAFHNACCGGLFKKPLVSHNPNPSFNIFDQNKGSIFKKPGQIQQSIDKQSVEPVKASVFTGTSEKFPSSRKPPSFDENGYHY